MGEYSRHITLPCITEVRRCDKTKVSEEWEQRCQSSLKAVDKHPTYSTVLLSKCSMASIYYLINASYFTELAWHLMVEWLCERRIAREIKENRNDLLQGKITAFAWRH